MEAAQNLLPSEESKSSGLLPVSRSALAWGVLAISALALKLVYCFSLARPPHADELTYLSIAENLIEGNGFASMHSAGPTAFVMPAYPLFLSIVLIAFNEQLSFVDLAQVLLSVVMAGSYGRLVFLWTRQQRLGFLAALFAFVLPPFFLYTNRLLTEIFFAACFALALLAWETLRQKPTNLASWIALGIFHSMSLLTRPVTALLTPIILIWVLIEHRAQFRKSCRGAMLAMLLIVLFWGPWIIRNHRVFGGWIPLTTSSGFTLMGGSLEDFENWEKYSYEALREAGISAFNENEHRSNQIISRAARDRIAEDYPAYVMRSVKRCWRFWLSEYKDLTGRQRSFGSCIENRELGILFAKLVLAGTSASIMLLAVLSIPLAIWRPRFAPYMLLIAYFTAMHAMLMPIPRYSAPIAPLVVALGIAGVHEISLWLAGVRRLRHD